MKSTMPVSLGLGWSGQHDDHSNASRWVPAEGVHLVEGGDGRHPHVLVADPGTCRWSPCGGNPVVENTAPVYLLHPEHGGTGIAPGRWVVRRQRELAGLVAD